MRRRVFLASAAGGVATVAGCLSDGDTGTDDPTTGDRTPTDAPTDTRTDDRTPDGTDSAPTADLRVSDVRLQYGVVTPSSPDSIGVFDQDTQYLVASVSADGSLPREDVAFEAGGSTFAPTTDVRLFRTAWGDAEWYTAERTSGLLLFEGVESATGSDPKLTWPGGERSLGDAVASRLGADPPAFSVTWKAPETHDSATPPPLHLDVTNESGRAARFVGAINRTGPRVASTPVEAMSDLVPAGETVTLTIRDEWGGLPGEERIGDGDPDVTYRLDYLGGEASAAIRIVESAPE